MQITKTSILDQNFVDNTNASKVFVMNNIVDHFVPLFQEEIDRKQKQFERNSVDIVKLRAEVKETANHLKHFDNQLRMELEIEKVLGKVKRLADYDVLYGNNRRLAMNAVLSIQTGDIFKIKKSSLILENIIFKNINKVIT